MSRGIENRESEIERRDSGWVVSAEFDLAWFVAPMLVPALVALALSPYLAGLEGVPLWAWVVFILLVDVAHVWSTLYRTYLDRRELARRPWLYTLTPLGCFALGAAIYGTLGQLAFWRTLAYLAVFHFVRQQYGFLALYDGRDRRLSHFDRTLNRWTVYAATLGPILYWHTHTRSFVWFVPGDFVELSRDGLWTAAAVPVFGLYATFTLRQAYLWLARGEQNPGRVAVVGSTAIAWWTGIVLLDSDLAFTATNTLAHGVPYVALIWLTLNRQAGQAGLERSRFLREVAQPVALPLFLGILFGLAFFEEALWDHLVWQEHGALFGTRGVLSDAASSWLWLTVPLLALPQATHYVLDAFVWKLDGTNPGLREALMGEAK
ncbi:MAG: hypothetical protein HY816_10710 [Candidatus Wallbacteria bacterium]|nr:hypothetical protein [Candidatus Wallbacteria bacterium]